MSDNLGSKDLFDTYEVRNYGPIKLADRPVSYDLNRQIPDPLARKVDPFEEQKHKEYKVFKDPPRNKVRPPPKSPKRSPKLTKKQNDTKKTKAKDNTNDPLNSKNLTKYNSDVYDPFSKDSRKNDFRAFDDPAVIAAPANNENYTELRSPEEQKTNTYLPPVVAPVEQEYKRRTTPQPMNYNRSGVSSRDSTHWRINKPLILPVVKNDIDNRPKPYIYDRNVNSKYGDFNFNFYMFYL